MKNLLFALAFIVIIGGCNSGYDKTSTGLAYKIVSDGKGKKLKVGQMIKLHGVIVLAGKDSILTSTYGGLPVYQMVDSGKKSHDFTEILYKCRVGDSIIAVAQVDSMVKWGAWNYNQLLNRRDMIITRIKILDVFDNEAAQKADFEKEKQKFLAADTKWVEDYIKKKGIKAQKTKSGSFVEVTNPGVGIKGDSGMIVSVKYTGRFMTNDVPFDSNIGGSFGHDAPFEFAVGQGQVIRAWDEGFAFFGKGGKGRIFAPSMQAYGGQKKDAAGASPAIPAFSHLMFEIEVLDVKSQQPVVQPMDSSGKRPF
jgi:FKBP-type peptidyl-prolyl cis-trans isomerase